MTLQVHGGAKTNQSCPSPVSEEDFWLKLENLRRHPAYVTGPQVDPERSLLAAVVLRVICDVNPYRKIKAYDRETARQFLTDKEGQAWLRSFGIPLSKIMPLVNSLNRGVAD